MKKIFLFLFLFCNFVFAADNLNLYLIKNFNVNFTEKDVTAARKVAINYAEKMALKKVLQNINVNVSNASFFTDSELKKSIKSMQIFNEKNSKNSYSATLNIEFNSDYVNFVLNKYKVTEYSRTYNTYLIIPFLIKDGKTYLFEKNNTILDNYTKSTKNIRNIKVVQENFYSKMNLKNVNSKSSLTHEQYKGFNDYYYTNNIVFIFGTLDKDGNIKHKIYILNEKEKKDIELAFNGTDYNEAIIDLIMYLNSLDEEERSDQNDFLAENTDLILEEDFFKLVVEISNLKDSIDVEKVLGYNKNIIVKHLKMLNKKEMIFHVKVAKNDIQKFIESLEETGFSVTEKSEGVYAYLR
ncbi:MAG: hypothetical protein LBT02_01640 [Rickettsiales bacterium]|jgi:hypothetical protein|nr:hypothetical protein [Rickettsiales bacterium]